MAAPDKQTRSIGKKRANPNKNGAKAARVKIVLELIGLPFVWVVSVILLILVIALGVAGQPASGCSSGTGSAGTIPGAKRVWASDYGGPKDPSTHGDGGKYGSLSGKAAFAELSTNPNALPLDFSALGSLFGLPGPLPPYTLFRVTNPASGITLVMQKLDVGGGGKSLPKMDVWWEAANALKFPYPGLGYLDIAPAKPGDVPSLTPVSNNGSTNTVITSSNCVDTGSGSNNAVAAEALKLAWPQPGADASPPRNPLEPTPAYVQAMKQYNPGAALGGADCGSFVATVMHASGTDPSYPDSQTMTQQQYVESSKKYVVYPNINSTSELHPGDILIINKGSGAGGLGHTMIYVGPQRGTGYDEASASEGTRMGNLDFAPKNLVDPGQNSRGHYIVARFK